MSELYMIVIQGKEELKNDPEAIKLWSELSGVDINSINENTPFDIDVADRLLRTLPEVIEKMREKAKSKVESLEEGLKKVLESKSVVEKSVQEWEEEPSTPEKPEKPEATPTKKYEIVEEPTNVNLNEVVNLYRIEGRRIHVLKGAWREEYDPIFDLVSSEMVSGFSIFLKGGTTLHGERSGSYYVVGEFSTRNLGMIKILFNKILKTIS